MPDEMIKEIEHYALVGDQLDWTFVEMMGMPPFYNERYPKPPTPELTEEEKAALEAAALAEAEAKARAEEAAARGEEAPAEGFFTVSF